MPFRKYSKERLLKHEYCAHIINAKKVVCKYISLHIFIPIHLNLFSDITREGCNILTHHLASNIFYHILPSSVSIEGNILKLIGNEKKYFEYFGREDIIERIIQIK